MATSVSSTTAPASTPMPTTTPGTTSTLTPGKIAGVTVGSIAGVFLIIFPIGFVWRRRQKAAATAVRPPEEPGTDSSAQGSTSKDMTTVTQAKVEGNVNELP